MSGNEKLQRNSVYFKVLKNALIFFLQIQWKRICTKSNGRAAADTRLQTGLSKYGQVQLCSRALLTSAVTFSWLAEALNYVLLKVSHWTITIHVDSRFNRWLVDSVYIIIHALRFFFCHPWSICIWNIGVHFFFMNHSFLFLSDMHLVAKKVLYN